jgi:hypothetical protein
MSKTTEELIKEFLDKGGEIEILEPMIVAENRKVRSIQKKVPELMTLPQAEHMFGKKQVKKKKIKEPDFSNINIDLIPEHLRGIMKQKATTKETPIETNKNSRCTDVSNKS